MLALHAAFVPFIFSCHYGYCCVLIINLCNEIGCYVTVGWFGHFLFSCKVYPKLKSEHALRRLGHFLMEYAVSCCHPLTCTGSYYTFVAEAVHMLNLTFNEVGDCFYTPVRVHGEAFDIVRRVCGVKGVQKQKRIELFGVSSAQYTVKMYSGSVHRSSAFYSFLNCAKFHGQPPYQL